MVTYFNLGIIIGTVPSQMIQLKYVRPSIWIPACEVSWSILVMAMAAAKDVKTVSAPTSSTRLHIPTSGIQASKTSMLMLILRFMPSGSSSASLSLVHSQAMLLYWAAGMDPVN